MKFVQSIFNKYTSKNLNGVTDYLHYGAFRYVISGLLALGLLIMSRANGFNLTSLKISLLGAAALVINMFCSLEAMKSGAMVLVTLAGSAGLLIPCISGIFMFDEKMSLVQWGGIGLLLISAFLLAGYSKQLNSKFSLKTILLLIAATVSNGLIMLSQKMYSQYVPEGNASVFSFLIFGISGLLLLLAYGGWLAVKHEKPKMLPKKLWIYGVILSISLLIINQLATIAGAIIPSAILFSVNDGGGTIITAVVAAIFYHEKLTFRSVSGILLGIGALIVINLW